MTKTPRNLVLRRQTLRVLADLDLARAAGGFNSADARCLAATTDTGAAACPGTVTIVRTAIG